MKNRSLSLVLLGCGMSLAVAQRAPQIDRITADDLKADLYFLGSDEMAGRLTNTPENRLAAQFIKSRFEAFGLEPVNGSYFQSYFLMTFQLGTENRLEIRSKGLSLQKQLMSDFVPLNFSATGSAQGELVFVGFGIDAPGFSQSDYQGDVRGKIVLVMQHEPGENDPDSRFDGLVSSEASRDIRKALWAQKHGAIGIVFVPDVHNHGEGANFERRASRVWPTQRRRIPRFALASWVEKVQIPAVSVSTELAEHLISGSGHSLRDLGFRAENDGGMSPLPVPGYQIRIETEVGRTKIQDRNVVGFLPGSDPELKDEVIILCAHYDHDGASETQVYNGADDDGSGTVGLISLAQAYSAAARAGQRPRRSLLFAAWNSEERGLLGAWTYTENPLFPLQRTAAVFNMDMIGRNEEVPAGGGRRFRGLEPQTAESNNNAVNVMGYTFNRELRAMAEKTGSEMGLTLRFRYDNNPSNLLRRSDHWPFLQRGVPALFFHTGLHPDYHPPNDRPERINYPKMEKILRVIYQLTWEVADRDGLVEFHRPVLETRGHIEE